jgi:hypothetical protein
MSERLAGSCQCRPLGPISRSGGCSPRRCRARALAFSAVGSGGLCYAAALSRRYVLGDSVRDSRRCCLAYRLYAPAQRALQPRPRCCREARTHTDAYRIGRPLRLRRHGALGASSGGWYPTSKPRRREFITLLGGLAATSALLRACRPSAFGGSVF